MIKQQLEDFKETFDKALSNYFDSKIIEAKKIGETSEPMLKILKEFTIRGGKRVRPALVYNAYTCFSNEKLDEAIKAGIASELVQSFLLIHDDIMDNDELRRGKPTVHKIYSEYFNDSELGRSLAILCGDLSVSLANELLLSIDLPAERKIKAGILLNEVLNKVGFGQELDVISSKEKEITQEELFKIHRLKTAKYTFEGPLLIGATLGGATQKDLEILKGYSTPVGLAFQLQDDILGLFGDEKKLGKKVGSDIREGKKTLLILKAKEKCSTFEKRFLEKTLGNKNVSSDDIKKVREIVIATGSLDYNKSMIKNLLDEAKDELKDFNCSIEGKIFLLELADYLEKRDY